LMDWKEKQSRKRLKSQILNFILLWVVWIYYFLLLLSFFEGFVQFISDQKAMSLFAYWFVCLFILLLLVQTMEEFEVDVTRFPLGFCIFFNNNYFFYCCFFIRKLKKSHIQEGYAVLKDIEGFKIVYFYNYSKLF
jgi:hypothetical protein